MSLINLGVALLALSLSGCGPSADSSPPPTLPPPPPTATPEVGFAVEVTAIPVNTPRPTPRPSPTRFVVPSGPYIALDPASGPPVGGVVTVRGGHLPSSSEVRVGWSQDGRTSPVSTTARTDGKGSFTTTFSVPGAAPGQYRVIATVGGARYASAIYRVRSEATITARVAATSAGERLHVTGHEFVPDLQLLLVAYPIDFRGKPLLVGQVQSNAKGTIGFTRVMPKLALGQYVLRAWSQNGLTAPMAETYFQVVI